MHRKRWLGLALAAGFSSAPLPAQPTEQRITDQRIEELEKKVDDLEKAKQKNEAAGSATVAADTTGFTVKSNDGNFKLKIGADLQLDNRSFYGAGSEPLGDGTVLRRVRPTFSGTVYKYIDYYFRPDFGLGQTVIYDAYVQLNYFSRVQLRVGKFKPPVGLERLQSDDDTSFVERGLPTLLVPSRDIGYQLGGDIVKGRAAYQVGVFNGVADNSLSDAAVTRHKEFAARVFLTPFLPDTESRLSGLGFGIGATGGSVDGLPLPAFKTIGQTMFFPFASGVAEAGHRTRLAPQGYYYLGPFGLFSEYTVNRQGLQKETLRREIAFRSWQAQLSYILTGEKKAFTAPAPRQPFDPHRHEWGAVELAARLGNFTAERGLFNYGLASAADTPRRAQEWAGSVNWYFNRLARTSVTYGYTRFWGGSTPALGGNRPSERVLLLRFQINFI